MGEFVIYMQGATSGAHGPVEECILNENAEAAGHVRALRQSGHTVLHLGNAERGFTLPELAAAVRDFPYCTTFIFNGHGGEGDREGCEEKRCDLRLGPVTEKDDDKNCAWVSELFTTITENNFGQPVNAFILACGSRAAYLDIDKLSLGSTLVTFGNIKTHENVAPDWRGFSVPYVQARNFAEQLCLNMQAYGMRYNQSILQIAVNRADTAPDCSGIDMWYQATGDSICEPHHDMPEDFIKTMRADCAPYMSDGTFNEVIDTLQLHAQNSYKPFVEVITAPRTPVKVRMVGNMDLDAFRKQVADNGLMGPIGVYAYLLAERFSPMGAFQTLPQAEYEFVPPQRPRVNFFEKLGLNEAEAGTLEQLITITAAAPEGLIG